MDLDFETVNKLEKHFDGRYVLQSDCNEKQESVNKKFANDDKRMTVTEKDVGFFKKLAWILVTSTVGQLVLMVFDLIKEI